MNNTLQNWIIFVNVNEKSVIQFMLIYSALTSITFDFSNALVNIEMNMTYD